MNFFMHHTSDTPYIHLICIHGEERSFCQRDAIKWVENKLVMFTKTMRQVRRIMEVARTGWVMGSHDKSPQ